MHQNATSAIKWEGNISEQFPVIQGVCLGGILSADLCKLYINPLLGRLENTHIGSRIGNVLCNASACADDIALMSRTDSDIQIFFNTCFRLITYIIIEIQYFYMNLGLNW
jgi:hypothetical protein